MIWSLETPVETPEGTVCAFSERECHLSAFGERLHGWGTKVPKVIVLIRDGRISGVDLAGRPLSEGDLNLRFPGALDALRDLQ